MKIGLTNLGSGILIKLMAYSKRSGEQARQNRMKAGARIKHLRNQAGLTQKELAEKVNQGYYTFISQVETGYARVPPEDYVRWAKALGLDTQEFVKDLLSYYEPETHSVLFPKSKKT